MRKITCTNITNNTSAAFGDHTEPFRLGDADGLYTVDVTVNSVDNSMTDGSTVAGSVVKARNIVLTLADKPNYGVDRNLLYYLFMPKTKGVLTYEESADGFYEKREIDYVVEKVDSESTGTGRMNTISLHCPDPFFRDIYDTTIDAIGWEAGFEFDHEFVDAGEEISTFYQNKLVTLANDSTVGNIGFTIELTAEAEVVNPRLYSLEQEAYIQIGSSGNPFTLNTGETLIISTVSGNKNVYLISNGVRTIVNNYIEEGSEYIQLINGTNTIRMSADSGEDHLLMKISYRYKFQGV